MASSLTSLRDGFTVGVLRRVKAKAGRIAVEKFSCGHSTWAQSAAELAAYLSAMDGSRHFYCYHSGADGTKDDWGWLAGWQCHWMGDGQSGCVHSAA